LQASRYIQALGTVMERLLHPDVRRNRRAAAAHARFIGARLLIACLACAVLPAYLFFNDGLSAIEVMAMASVALLLVPAAFVSMTGRLDRGHDLSSILLSASIVALAIQSGGLQSPVLPLFAVVLLDTAFSGARGALKGAVASCLIGLGLIGFLPVYGPASAASSGLVAGALTLHAAAMAWAFLGRGERHATSQMRSQARATAALDTVGDVVLWREASGEISFANAAAHAELGLDRRAFNETFLVERINVGDRPAYLKAVSDARNGASPRGQALVRIAAEREGALEVRLFEMTARPVEASGSEPAVIIGLRDVTERHAADELREIARQEAERIATSKTQFLATMSHELRTPLNAIIGFSELLTQPDLVPQNDPRRDEYARIINGSGQHLLEVVNAILDMSKIESGMMTVEQERVELGRVIASSRELLAVRAADKAVSLVEAVASDLPDVISDRRALKQILLNLMSNAVKFTPAGGEVTVTAVRDRDHVEIVVADTGCGIAESDLERLGAPFFQARQSYDRQHEGTGLGLSVVRGLLGLLGGSMLIESAMGAGTRVAIRLPVFGKGASTTSEPVSIATRIRARRPALDAIASRAEAEPAPAPVRFTA
jgi:cell cycle sensor histidine kinase DivJ